jgi:hypothetical protein
VVKAQARSTASPAVVSNWSDGKKVVIDPVNPMRALAMSHVELGAHMDANGSILEAMRLSDDDGRCRVAVLEGTRALSAIGTPLGAIDVRTVLEPPLPPDGHYVVGQAIRLGPEGASFSPPVILTMSYDRASYSDKVIESTLVIASYDVEKERWVECESAVDAVSGTVVAQVGHFSTFALLGKSANQSSASVGWALALGIIAAALTVGLVTFFVVNRRRRLQHLDSGLDQL